MLPCYVVTAKWVVSCTRITCIQPLSPCSLTLLASSFFSESVFVFTLFSPSFPPWLLSLLSLVHWPFRTRLLACLIRAAILYFSCRLHLFTSRCFVSGSPDSVLLYQFAAFVFLDGSRVRGVSLELLMVSLAFHLSVVGTVIFALCSSDCSRPLLCCRQ